MNDTTKIKIYGIFQIIFTLLMILDVVVFVMNLKCNFEIAVQLVIILGILYIVAMTQYIMTIITKSKIKILEEIKKLKDEKN